MSITTVSVTVQPNGRDGQRLLAPVGIPTPYQTPSSFAVSHGRYELAGESGSGQMAAVIQPEPGAPVTLTYRFADHAGHYPEELFRPRTSRFTRAADALVHDARRIADGAANGHAAIAAIVNDVAEKFSYGHPDVRFNDGLEEIPHLGCGLTEGSCVDINTYLIAALRAAGFEAGYVYGYFFPAEKGGTCNDGHCWVVTRHQGAVLEWDIAHHLKLGTREVCCGLNPKPGNRVAVAHSMGLEFAALGITGMKLLGEPIWIGPGDEFELATVKIRMSEPDARARLTEKIAI
ncbi:transglutaminase domain-containing protein [Oricola sp.]|uniref:transglutaminase domain-containing protein n=1 Tax=Oricola sp. TaxID=1979950 RepID=UPI003BAB711A